MRQFVLSSLLLILVVFWGVSEAAILRGVFKDPAHPGKCVITPSLILSEGQAAKHPTMDCARAICGKDGHAQIHTCGTQGVMPGCELGARKYPSADYPQCCERHVICKP
ncbi:uncharacterized protein LOC115630471 [Scaptodrosophila lebanonensis]|uniref:Uncharacterized protein LOC115630471 n=1 Tax=Drosophila lebanonensis TaxID=7225 RepID=A0A6J2U6W2_DROLE|nr:uncharacterized protein LOC115630471 [Scaptodrosophila lebanonensis]